MAGGVREKLSRADLGKLSRHNRNFDPIDVLLAATEDRVPKLLPIKYGRMAVSPFAFYRGAVSIMAADLARLPHTGLIVQLCGDAHVQNLGSFEAPDGKLVFDINDFDETVPGPWEWDVKRMAGSIVLAGREAGHGRSGCSTAVETFAQSYCRAVDLLAQMPILDAARHQIHRQSSAKPISQALRQSERACPMDLVKKLTEKSERHNLRFKTLNTTFWRVGHAVRRDVLAALPF